MSQNYAMEQKECTVLCCFFGLGPSGALTEVHESILLLPGFCAYIWSQYRAYLGISTYIVEWGLHVPTNLACPTANSHRTYLGNKIFTWVESNMVRFTDAFSCLHPGLRCKSGRTYQIEARCAVTWEIGTILSWDQWKHEVSD